VTAPPAPAKLPSDADSVKFSEAANDPSFRIIIDKVAAEKKAALADPGPPWREWALHSGLKPYVGLAFLIVDGWIAGYFLFINIYWPIAPCLVGALYLEYLAWQCLWYRPETFRRHVRRRSPSPWVHPVPYGRWTPEADLAQAGELIPPGGPDPTEFL
jgi:hypothetical protein